MPPHERRGQGSGEEDRRIGESGWLAREHGIEYFLATVILAGLFQIVLGLVGVAKLMRFIPRSVMVGAVRWEPAGSR